MAAVEVRAVPAGLAGPEPHEVAHRHAPGGRSRSASRASPSTPTSCRPSASRPRGSSTRPSRTTARSGGLAVRIAEYSLHAAPTAIQARCATPQACARSAGSARQGGRAPPPGAAPPRRLSGSGRAHPTRSATPGSAGLQKMGLYSTGAMSFYSELSPDERWPGSRRQSRGRSAGATASTRSCTRSVCVDVKNCRPNMLLLHEAAANLRPHGRAGALLRRPLRGVRLPPGRAADPQGLPRRRRPEGPRALHRARRGTTSTWSKYMLEAG
jgi:hypothetical protein